MKTAILSLALLASFPALAQTNQTAAEDFTPASTNQRDSEYPQVNSEGRVRARIMAPQAQSVMLDISGVKYPMTKDAEGAWTGDSAPLDEGNHYYQLVVDGAQVPDPGSTYIFGSGRWRNHIEIPAEDQEFYALKNGVASASVCDGVSLQAVVFAPDYGSEDNFKMRSLV